MKMLLSVAILISGAQAFSQLPPSPAATSATLSGDFTAAKAMTALYGSYDDAKKTSPWDARKLGAFPIAGDGQVKVQLLLDAPYEENGVKKHTFITWARHYLPGTGPDDFDSNACHACGVILGLALFAQAEPAWKAELQNLKWKQLGAWGSPPNSVNFATMGENAHALVIHQTDMHQGVVSSYFSVYALLNGKVRPVFGEETEDFSTLNAQCGRILLARDKKITKAQSEKMCADPDEKIEFVPSTPPTPKQPFFDLSLIRSFHGLNGIEPVEVKTSYTFSNSTMKYVRKPASK